MIYTCTLWVQVCAACGQKHLIDFNYTHDVVTVGGKNYYELHGFCQNTGTEVYADVEVGTECP